MALAVLGPEQGWTLLYWYYKWDKKWRLTSFRSGRPKSFARWVYLKWLNLRLGLPNHDVTIVAWNWHHGSLRSFYPWLGTYLFLRVIPSRHCFWPWRELLRLPRTPQWPPCRSSQPCPVCSTCPTPKHVGIRSVGRNLCQTDLSLIRQIKGPLEGISA